MEDENTRVLSERQQLSDFIKRLAILKHDISGSPVKDDNSLDYDLINSFDVNSYFKVFDKLRMRQGKVLDYVYAFDRKGGMPFLYARDIEEPPIKDMQEFWRKFPKAKVNMIIGEDNNLNTISPYIEHLEFEKSLVGYVQFSSFLLVSNRFFLFWHALYNRRNYFFSKSALEYHINKMTASGITFTVQEQSILGLIDPYPKMVVYKNKVETYLFNVEPTQNGFYWSKITYKNDVVSNMEVINVVENKSCVFY